MSTLVREPYVADKFYPGKRSGLDKIFIRLLDREKDRINYKLSETKIIGTILPHAGYIYSGYQNIHFFEIISRSEEIFDTFIILHPNHRSIEYHYATDECEKWLTPYGAVPLDSEFIKALDIPKSERFHKYEHSGEVILPFLQKYITYPFHIVPLSLGKQTPEIASEISGKITEAVDKTGKKICIIASSDFSHYVKPDYGRMMDQKVVDKIFALDASGIYNEIINNNISVCGYAAIMALVNYSKNNYPDLNIEILARGHSGEIYPSAEVVDYISMLFFVNK